MFERQVTELLRTYLGEYIDGLDTDSLNIRVWKGAPGRMSAHLRILAFCVNVVLLSHAAAAPRDARRRRRCVAQPAVKA
jgi:hypothetical protein